MNEFIKKLIERLKEVPTEYRHEEYNNAIWDVIRFINQLAEEYGDVKNSLTSDGWISVDERFPDTDKYILLSFANFSLPLVGRWEEDEAGGAFYIGDEMETCVSQDIFVNAWQPLPEPYQPKGE